MRKKGGESRKKKKKKRPCLVEDLPLIFEIDLASAFFLPNFYTSTVVKGKKKKKEKE